MKTTAIVFTILAGIGCCIAILCLAMLGLGIFAADTSSFQITLQPQVIQPTQVPVTPAQVLPPSGSTGSETLETLLNAEIPENDPVDLAVRLGEAAGPIPRTLQAPARPRTIGMVESFWASNTDTNENFKIEATLQYITEHTYFWVENDVSFNPDDLQALAEEFENHIYPTVRAFFGSEWSPGVDNDPRIYILYARDLGTQLAGYFSSADELHPLAHPYSNGHEMFFLNADTLNLDEPFTYGVLAHEFQHMIHWNGDRNEETWINEGFSEVAALLTGYYDGGFDIAYARDPDIPLLFWPDDGPRIPHYGGAFLYLSYFLERFGSDATRELVFSPENGLKAIDEVLSDLEISDPLHGSAPSAEDVFQDFSAALVLQDPDAADGRYSLSVYPDAPRFDETERIRSCPAGPLPYDVHQFGIDIYRITCLGDFNLKFSGSTTVPVLPVNAVSGSHAFWSNRGDEADTTLTREFDFTGHTGALTLEYRLWYDIEEDYDYAYLLASRDGESWQILETPRSTLTNPTGSSYGPAYNGRSGSWVHETVDLSQFAGEKVFLRFEYITDAAVNGEGLLIDDLAIPEIGFFTDFENDDDRWIAEGFVRIDNVLPQTYRITLIENRADGSTVSYLELEDNNTAVVSIEIGEEVDEVLLIVSGTTRFSRQKTGYSLEILP